MKMLIVLVLVFAATAAMAQTTTAIRDSAGREVGTVTTDRDGTTTYRDRFGRETGTATRR
jgi:hypothetical protein